MLTIKTYSSIFDFSEAEWDSLNIDTPFNRFAFLAALESSQSVGGETGWLPCYFSAKEQGELIAVFICFKKSHSWGEYVFDWSWADAYQSYGREYYPKLVSTIPFTPVPCNKLLTSKQLSAEQLQTCIEALKSYCQSEQCFSWHWLFVPTPLKNESLIKRHTVQFHWFNRGYSSFDDFLATFTSKKRKNVRQERNKIAQCDLSIEVLEGNQITDHDWQHFYACYQTTYLKRGHQGYLSLDFFYDIQQRMPENIVLIAAKRGDDLLAGALFFKDNKHLYGRYWGCLESVAHLHFELCYYQGIEYAIKHGLKSFNPGTQGEHKIARGFEPVTLQSYHWLTDDFLKAPIENFCQQEIQHYADYADECRESLPFKDIKES